MLLLVFSQIILDVVCFLARHCISFSIYWRTEPIILLPATDTYLANYNPIATQVYYRAELCYFATK